MHARISRYQGPPERYDEGFETSMQTVMPALRQVPGNLGVIALVDRSTGEALTITLWDGEDSLRASEERANELRRQNAEASSEEITDVSRFEVSLLELRAAVPAPRAPQEAEQPVG